MNKSPFRIPVSQFIFTLFFLAFLFTVLNGYLLNLVSGYQANAWAVLAGLVVELAVVAWIARGRIAIAHDPLELAGFGLVVVGVWLYFVAASLPTFLPPTQSMDAVRHYTQALFSYPKGTLVSWYPAGGAFLAAMLSRWTGLSVLRLLHPVAASFIALSAGAIYGIACDLLPRRRLSKVTALIAPALLFVPWSFFAGIIDGEQYFYAQAFAQLFVVSAWWYIASYAESNRGIYLVLIGAALIGIVTAYPYLVALPLLLFVILQIARWISAWQMDRSALLRSKELRITLVALVLFALLIVVMTVALERGGILEFRSIQPATQSEVGEGGVANPTVETLGGPLFLLLALIGLFPAWRAGRQGRTLLAFLLAWLVQLAVLALLQPLFRISGYRLDKTYYVLVFPLALAAAMPLERLIHYIGGRLSRRQAAIIIPGRLYVAATFLGTVIVLSGAVLLLRPPVAFTPLTEGELQAAQWAKEHLNTYQTSYLEPQSIRAYWLIFGLWGETVPNGWEQWIPAGTKMGPKTYDEWLHDDAWPPYLLVRDVNRLPSPLPQVLYRYGDAAILQKQVQAQTPPEPRNPALLYYGSTLKFLGYDLPRTKFAPGDTLTVTTYAESLQPPRAAVNWRLEMMDRDQAVLQLPAEPFGSKYPIQRWPPGQYEKRTWTLPLDAQTRPGVYDLRLGLFRSDDGESVNAHPLEDEFVVQQHLHAVPVGRIKIPPPPPGADELQKATAVQARFGDTFLLSRYALDYAPGERVMHLALYWQSLAETKNDYTVFVHVLDATGQVVAQKDSQPLDGRYPTSVWDAQEIIKEGYTLSIPADGLAPYSIEIGMYAFPSVERLPVNGGDHVMLPNVIR